MNETTLKIAIAGFFHDIGKLTGRETFGVTWEEIERQAADFLPVYKGRYSHHHALYTAMFIEKFKDYLPKEFDRPWGDGDGLVKLTASHHSPSSPMEWIIAEADRISSGMDRKSFEAYTNESIAVTDYEKTRLVSVLESLDVSGASRILDRKQYKHGYALTEMSPDTIFPKKIESVTPDSKDAAKAEYAALIDGFTEGLKGLCHPNHIGLWFEHFESLVMRFASQMPAARVGRVIPDVSLYDHLKTTSALASAIYSFHKDTDTLTVDEVKKGHTEKFLLISGDFHGIQNFIFSGYGDTRKYRSKLLRGRSFYVSVLTELTACLLCEQIGLPSTSVVLDAGGKFTIIGPNTEAAQHAVQNVQQQLEQWFVRLTFGESGISLSAILASPDDFKSGGFPSLHDQMNRKMAGKKLNRINLNRFGGVVQNYFDTKQAILCPFCGKRPADESILMPDGQATCRLCRDHVFIGDNLVKKNSLAVLLAGSALSQQGLMEPVFDYYQLSFSENAQESVTTSGGLLKYWKLKIDHEHPANNNAAFRFFNGYVPVYRLEDLQDPRFLDRGPDDETTEPIEEGALKTMNHIAAAARTNEDGKLMGLEALGILKADVDHLGLLMACGLPDNLYSVSRLATLSRQMNNFFTVFLPWFLENSTEYRDVYTIFAGGDDLLLIGPWNKMIPLAASISESFNRYVCNPAIHLSAGISIHKAHTPIDTMATAAETAVKKSKNDGRSRITLFGQTVTWAEAEQLQNVKEVMEKWLDEKYLSRVMFYRLNRFIDMAEQESLLIKGDSIHIRHMACTKWRSLLSYAVERNIGKTLAKEEKQRRIMEVRETLAEWLATWQGKLRIPLWQIQYNRR
ncbi:MAG: type III-A CRISPR-associated protein Cas10/Csm1 [Desulfobacterales bacterium]|nr:type III-A CRISPR-associated protein Cas10/Csm1 [Desulfobacterales bacterium]